MRKAVERRGAQGGAGFAEAWVDQLHDGVNRQNHEGQEDVGGAQDQSGLGEQQTLRFVPDAEPDQELGDDTVAAQHDLPSEGLDHRADRERQDDRDQHHDLDHRARAGEREGRRIADDEAEERDPGRDPERVADHAPIERIAHEGNVGLDRQTRWAGKTLHQQPEQRVGVDDQQIEDGRHRQQNDGIAPRRGGGRGSGLRAHDAG